MLGAGEGQLLGTKPALHTTGEGGQGTKRATGAAVALQTVSERLGSTWAWYTPLGAARCRKGERSDP